MIKQPKLSPAQEAKAKSRRYFKHLAMLPNKLRARRERQRQAELMNARINRLAGLALKRLELDDPRPDADKAVLTEQKRQLSRQITQLRKTIEPWRLEAIMKAVDDVNGQRLAEREAYPDGKPPAYVPPPLKMQTRTNFWGRETRGGL